MSDRILDVAADHDDAVSAAAEALRDSQLVVVPTDTVYGVAADAFDPVGTRRIFGAKRRSRRFPLPVLVRSPKQLLGLCPSVPPAGDRLMAAYWPGPLTLVVAAEPTLDWDLGDTRGTVAVRMPLDDVTLDLIRAVGPLAVTSANLSGRPAATTAADAHGQLGELVAIYLDAGERNVTSPSTIVDLTRGDARVLRDGPLPHDDVLAVARDELDPIEAANRLLVPTEGSPDDAPVEDATSRTAPPGTAEEEQP